MMESSPRKIVHLDLDAFFCAVEEQRDPTLVGKPFAVGGSPDARGVVASCSYAARVYGIRSAMPMARARQLYPKLIIVSQRHRAYSAVSRKVMKALHDYVDKIEQLSIDEAFLDATARPETGETLARMIQTRIRNELKLPCSLGVATNKLVAKIATDFGKASRRSSGPPNAIHVVAPGREAEFLAPLPAEALWGVGPKTAARLAELGLRTIGDIARWPEDDLVGRFGKHGRGLARRARGIDDSPVEPIREAKSVSNERTFARDIYDEAALHDTLRKLSRSVARRLRRVKKAGTTVKLKYRQPDFTTLTRQTTLDLPTNREDEIYETAVTLFNGLWSVGRGVRLLGVGISGLGSPERQLSFWEKQPDGAVQQTIEKEKQLEAALDDLRTRFGDQAVRWGSDPLIDPMDEA
jgi:DNA polymerase-4